MEMIRAKERAAQTRSKEEDNLGWISIPEKVRRGSETTQEVTRHRTNLVSISEIPGHANMAITGTLPFWQDFSQVVKNVPRCSQHRTKLPIFGSKLVILGVDLANLASS